MSPISFHERAVGRHLSFFGLVFVCIVSLGVGSATAQEEAPRAVILPMDGMISPLTQASISRRLDRAEAEGADFVIIRIDSPGGELNSSIEIGERLAEIGWARTVAYVPRGAEAISGATFVALGADEIVLHPDILFGDAGAIALGEGGQFEYAPEKFLSVVVPRLRALARRSGKPEALVEAMLDRKAIVHEVRDEKTGERRYMTEAELEVAADRWEDLGIVPESREERFLTVEGARAEQLGLADAVAETFDDLKQRYGIEGEPKVLDETWIDTAALILSSDVVTVLLLIVGLVCLYIEFSAPGIGIAGLASGLCFVLFFWSKFLSGTAEWLEVTLFVAGLGCLAVELFVLPGFGVFGLTGVLLVLGSVYMAFHRFVIPTSQGDIEAVARTVILMGATGVFAVAIMAFLGRYLPSLPLLGSMILHPPEPTGGDVVHDVESAETESDGQRTHAWLLGKEGVTATALRPAGKVDIAERQIDVVAECFYIAEGSNVRVIKVRGNRIVVREIS